MHITFTDTALDEVDRNDAAAAEVGRLVAKELRAHDELEIYLERTYEATNAG